MTEQISLGGAPRVGFELAPSPWRMRARARLEELNRMIDAGRGNELVSSGGCTDPGGGIVPTAHTARELAGLIRSQIHAGLGQAEALIAPATTGSSPWVTMLATSVVSAAAGWAIEEVARTVRDRKRRR